MSDAMREALEPEVQLQARRTVNEQWIDIFPAQVEWMSSAHYMLRAIERPKSPALSPATVEAQSFVSLSERFVGGKSDWRIERVIPERRIVVKAFGDDRLAAEKEIRALIGQPASNGAVEALKPFAAIAEHDIGESEADEDIYQPMRSGNNRAPLITVGDLRRAKAALTGLVTSTDQTGGDK